MTPPCQFTVITMNILSLCDGMSCGQIALQELGVRVDAYYASEIKPEAIASTKHNFPSTIHIGDVTKVSYKDGWLHTENGDFETDIDLVMFGSPCQSFSRGMRADKRIGLDDEVRSGIFIHCHRIMKEVGPKYFLLENVVMKKSDEATLTKMMGIDPIRVNSAQLTAQQRDRLYWTNIPIDGAFPQRNVTMNDILDDGGYYPYEKGLCLLASDSHGQYNGCNWTPVKRFYRWYFKRFSNLIFPSKKNFDACVDEFNRLTEGLDMSEINATVFDDYDGHVFDDVRYLSKYERARMQTVPEKYVDCMSEKDAANLLGDGWTIDVIKHIFKGIGKTPKQIRESFICLF